MTDNVSAETYLVLVPDTYNWNDKTYVRGIRVDRSRASKPSLKSGEVAIKLKLNFSKQSLVESVPTIALDVSSFLTGPAAPESVELVPEL